MRKIFLSIFSLLPLILFASQENLPDSISEQIKVGMKGFMERFHSPSITVVIVHDQNIIFGESMGHVDIEKKILATIDSKYPILSVTKTFTATMLMQLYEKGVINLDDDARKFIPELILTNSNSKDNISLLQLATHTSGLPRNSAADINFAKQVDQWMVNGRDIPKIEMSSKEEFLNSLKYTAREYPVYQLKRYGDRNYSNMGYSILGIALERAANVNYESYIIDSICSPLGMQNTGFLDQQDQNKHLVIGYRYNNEKYIKTPVFIPNSATYAGGLYSTATDLAKFISFQFRVEDSDVKKVLQDENKAMMQAFNIGWKLSHPFVLHEGAMLGFRSEITFNPELKIGWVILTNTSDFDFTRINQYISELIVPIYQKELETDISKYAGKYILTGGYGELNIYIKDNRLYSTYLHDIIPNLPLIPLYNNRFDAKGNNNYNIGYEFIFDETGKVILNLGQLMWIKQNK